MRRTDLMGLFQRRHSAGSNGRGAVAEAEAEVAPAAPEEAESADLETSPTATDAADPVVVETAPTATDETAPAVATSPADEDERPVWLADEEAPAAVASEPTASAPVPERPPFGLDEFPCLPLGAALWSDEIANVFNLSAVVPRMPNSLLVLTGANARAAAVVTDGTIVDAVWVSAVEGLLGSDAAQALMTADDGTLTAYMSDDPRLAAVLPMLWRWPRNGPSLPTAWLHTDDLVAEMRTSRRTCGLLFTSADPGIALFNNGELVGAFTTAHPWPGKSIAALWNLLHTPGSRVTVIGDSGPAAAEPTDDEPQAVTAPRRPSRATAARRAAAATAVAEAVAVAAVEESEAAAAVEEPEAAAAVEEPVAVTAVEEPVAVTAVEEPVTGTAVEEPEAAAAVEEPEAAAAVEEPEAAAAVEEPEATAAVQEPEAAAAVEEPEAVGDDLVADEPLTAAFGEHGDAAEAALEPTDMERVEAREAAEFVAPRLDIDVDALRTELIAIAETWLGAEDAALVVSAIRSARAGVDDFVSTIAAIGAMEIPGHERAVVRAMGREMHFRATEVLCGV
jgi:hypothetical protein